MKRILNAAVILLTVLLSASLPVSAEQPALTCRQNTGYHRDPL